MYLKQLFWLKFTQIVSDVFVCIITGTSQFPLNEPKSLCTLFILKQEPHLFQVIVQVIMKGHPVVEILFFSEKNTDVSNLWQPWLWCIVFLQIPFCFPWISSSFSSGKIMCFCLFIINLCRWDKKIYLRQSKKIRIRIRLYSIHLAAICSSNLFNFFFEGQSPQHTSSKQKSVECIPDAVAWAPQSEENVSY